MINDLVNKWFELLQYCQKGCFDRVWFRKNSDAWAKSWSRLSHADQGLCSELIHGRLISSNAPPYLR